MSKTPQFDKKINAILTDLKPHTRVCRFCDTSFEVEADDIEFYKKMQVPAPTLCPDCRHLRRALYRNARNLFKKKDINGQEVISLYRPESIMAD